MSRRSRKRKRQQMARKIKNKRADQGPLESDAMEQAMREALAEKGEELPQQTNRSFAESLRSLGQRVFKGGGAATPGSPRPRGADTQFIKRSGSGDVELVIGLDFGTSCTKVIIQDVATRTGYAVPFSSRMDERGSYLLPTIVSLDEQGIFNLERRGRKFCGLKENLMNIAAANPSNHDEKAKALMPHTIAYLALMFREARAWFMEEHEKDYQGRDLTWRINVGLPASRFDTRHMPVFYRHTVRKAW